MERIIVEGECDVNREILHLSSSVEQRTLTCSNRRDLRSHLENFNSTVFKTAECSLNEERKDRENGESV